MSPPSQSIFEEYNEDSTSGLGKFAQKSKDSPFVPIGITGLIGVLGYGAYKYKTRGRMTTSMFLMQLRVAAQGTVVGALTVGMIYSMAKDYLVEKPAESTHIGNGDVKQ